MADEHAHLDLVGSSGARADHRRQIANRLVPETGQGQSVEEGPPRGRGPPRPTGDTLRTVDGSAVDVPSYCATLGLAVSRAWTLAGRRDGALPEVAARVLADVEVPAGVTASSILEWVATTSDLPPQSRRSDPFGQPPLVLHHEDDFFIQALVWMEGTTAIHDHAFCGAFMVLEGVSLQVTYTFEPAERMAEDQLVVGDLGADRPEVLRPFDVRPIEPGEAFLHALFHLERPTVTIVVRNGACPLPYPQYEYLRPGLGWNSLWADRTWSKRLQSLRALELLDPAGARRTVGELVRGGASLWEAFLLVENLELDAQVERGDDRPDRVPRARGTQPWPESSARRSSSRRSCARS